jgi:hypothetical protein
MSSQATDTDKYKGAAGAIATTAGLGTLAGGLAARRMAKKSDPRFNLKEASKDRSQMLREKLEKSKGPIDQAAVTQQAQDVYDKSMQPAQQANIEALRSSMSGGLQPGQQLEMFGKATEQAQQEKAKATRDAYKTAAEQKAKEGEQAYEALQQEETRLRKERADKLFDKIPRMVGAAGVTLNKLAESGFLDDIIGVGGAIAGGAAGAVGGPAGIAAGAAKGFAKGKAVGETVQGAIQEGDLGGVLGGGDDEPEEPEATPEAEASPEEPAAEASEAEPAEAEEPAAEAEAPAEAEAQENTEAEMSERDRRLRDSLAAGIDTAEGDAERADAERADAERAEQRQAAESAETTALADDLARETLEDRRAAREEGMGEGGFEQDADELDMLGVGQSQIGGVEVENEIEHSTTLTEAQSLPPLRGGIMDVNDFNAAASQIFESQDPAAVNAAYIAAGVKPPNDEMPSAEQVAQARAAAGKAGTELNLLTKALQQGASRTNALRNILNQ